MAYNKIYFQQALNKRKWLLKRKGKRQFRSDLAFSFRICLLGDMLLLRDCLGCILQYIRLLSVHFNTSTFLWLPASPPEIRYINYTNGTCYFDEMMKACINIKNNSGLHPHQTLNKRMWLMKREKGHSFTHRFSFGERFDERMLSVYQHDFQYIKSLIHQFIGFSYLIKSAVEAMEVVSPSAGLSDGLPVCRPTMESRHRWQKEKSNQYPPTPCRYHRRLLEDKKP